MKTGDFWLEASVLVQFFTMNGSRVLCSTIFLIFLFSAIKLIAGDLSGKVSGSDVSVVGKVASVGDKVNTVAGAFAAGGVCTKVNCPATTVGAFAGVNMNGVGLSIEKTITPGIQSTLKENVNINLYNDFTNQVDANIYHTKTNLVKPDFKFDKVGGSLDYSNVHGHGASVGVNHIPSVGSNLAVTGKANLWKSTDNLASFDATGSVTRWINGHLAGRNSFGVGLGLNVRF